MRRRLLGSVEIGSIELKIGQLPIFWVSLGKQTAHPLLRIVGMAG